MNSLRTLRKTRDGRCIPVALSTAPLRGGRGEARGLIAALVDLSEQSTLEMALRDTQNRFRVAFDASPIAKVLVRLAERRIVEVNQAYLKLCGLSRDEVLNPASENRSLQIAPADSKAFWDMVRANERVTDMSCTFRTRAGQVREALASAEPMTSAGEEYVLIAIQDVTDRLVAERHLVEVEQRFRQLTETIHEVFWIIDVAKHQAVVLEPGLREDLGSQLRQRL